MFRMTNSKIEAIIDDSSPITSIWNRVRRFAEQRGVRYDSPQFALACPVLKLKISSLHWLLKRHFRKDTGDSIIPMPSSVSKGWKRAKTQFTKGAEFCYSMGHSQKSIAKCILSIGAMS